MEYDIVCSYYEGMGALIKEVNERIKDGWRPLGAPVVVYAEMYSFFQAMVKEEWLNYQMAVGVGKYPTS